MSENVDPTTFNKFQSCISNYQSLPIHSDRNLLNKTRHLTTKFEMINRRLRPIKLNNSTDVIGNGESNQELIILRLGHGQCRQSTDYQCILSTKKLTV